jgi:anti-anti-sigma regulatory factor
MISGHFTFEDQSAFLDITKQLDLANRPIGIDCSQMKSIDAAGIAELLRLRTDATRFSQPIVLRNLKEVVRKTFEIARLEYTFEILSREDFDERFPA